MVRTPSAPLNGSDAKGLLCPACGCADTGVVDTKPRFGRVYRRRECRHCGRRWTTCEVSQPPPETGKEASEVESGH